MWTFGAFMWFVAGGAVISAASYGVLSWASHAMMPMPLALFFTVLTIVTSVWIALWIHFRRHKVNSRAIGVCLAAAVLFRLIGFVGNPLYEDDFYRYLWDGYVFATQGNPYAVPPAEYFGSENLPAPFDQILTRVGYPEIPTIYGPVCQLSFLLGYRIARGQLWPLKMMFLAADLTLLLVVWKISGSPSAMVLYGWAPLVIKEVAFTAHPDVMAALLSVLAMWLSRRARAVAAAAILGAAVATKVIAVVLLPFVIDWRNRRGAVVFAIAVAGFYLPFLWAGGSDLAGLRIFATEWEFNSFGYAVLNTLFGVVAARTLAPALFLLLVASIWRWKRDLWRPDVVLILMFAFAPVVNPWYLLLVAPFMALQPSLWGIAAMSVVMLSYVTGINLDQQGLGPFEHPPWVRPVEAATVLLAAISRWPRLPRASQER